MRAFVAINLTGAERRRLAGAVDAIRERGYPFRWVKPDNVHLTLKFLGDAPEERCGELAAALDRAAGGCARFELRVRGVGAFPSPRRPQVVWVGVEVSEALEALQRRIERELEALGYPAERRPFRPHLTLGRARAHAKRNDFSELESLMATLNFEGSYAVKTVDLMRSQLKPSGAVHSILHSAPLS